MGGQPPGVAGQSMGGQAAGGRSMGGAAGAAAAGRGGNPSGGGAGAPSAGSGGGGTCTQNIRCKLDPPASTGDMVQDCVDRINQFRTQCACLPPLQRWTAGEACADQHAEYDSTRSAHAGFSANICMNGGSAQNECPGWGSPAQVVGGCLQSMWNEGPPPQTPCSGSCFQTYGHFINMTNTRYTRVACGFFQTGDGEWWAVQNFSN